MDAYQSFKTILYKWIGLAASLFGHEMFNPDLKISAYTVLAVGVGLTFPILYTWTVYHCDGDLRFSAIAYYGTGIQVRYSQIPIIRMINALPSNPLAGRG